MADGEGTPNLGSGVCSLPRTGGLRVGAVLWGYWVGHPRPVRCFMSWAPGPLQVEELGCLEVEAEMEAEAEARAERCGAAVPGQPLALVSGASALGFSGRALGGHGPCSCAQVALPAREFPRSRGRVERHCLALGCPGGFWRPRREPEAGGRPAISQHTVGCFRPFSHTLPRGPRRMQVLEQGLI